MSYDMMRVLLVESFFFINIIPSICLGRKQRQNWCNGDACQALTSSDWTMGKQGKIGSVYFNLGGRTWK